MLTSSSVQSTTLVPSDWYRDQTTYRHPCLCSVKCWLCCQGATVLTDTDQALRVPHVPCPWGRIHHPHDPSGTAAGTAGVAAAVVVVVVVVVDG